MTVKFEAEVLKCINCDHPRKAHGPAKEGEPCPNKSGFSKKSKYSNHEDKQWHIDAAFRNANLYRFVDTPMDEPTIKWKVGDKVMFGNFSDQRVEAVSDDGLTVVVSSAPRKLEDYEKRRGELEETHRSYRAVWWFELAVEDTGYGKGFKYFKEDHAGVNYTQHSLWEIVRNTLEKKYDDNPDYQRGYVWTLEDKTRFIESVFDESADLGKFIFVRYQYPRNHEEILDGKQRVSAIHEFCSSKFPVFGRYWHEFSRLDRHGFTSRLVQTARLDGDRLPKAELLRTFIRVNAAGVPQKEEHLEHVKKLLVAEEKGAKNEGKKHS